MMQWLLYFWAWMWGLRKWEILLIQPVATANWIDGCRVVVREKYSGLVLKRDHRYLTFSNMMPEEAEIFYGEGNNK
jgi:hypothetical protein